MADYMTARIEIPAWAMEIRAVREAIDLQGIVNRDLEEDGAIGFWDDDAAWGEFPDLEDALKEIGIAFDRKSDAKYEYAAKVRSYRPAGENTSEIDRTVVTGVEHDWIVPLEALEEAITQGMDAVRDLISGFGPVGPTVGEWGAANLAVRDQLLEAERQEGDAG